MQFDDINTKYKKRQFLQGENAQFQKNKILSIINKY